VRQSSSQRQLSVMWCWIFATITLLNTITALSLPASFQNYRQNNQYGNIPQYEVLELTSSELEDLLSNVHSPAIDHLLMQEEYGDANGDLGDYSSYPLNNDYYQEDDNDQIHQLKWLQDYMNEGQQVQGEDRQTNLKMATTTAPPTTEASTTTTSRPVIRRMTKERRGMMEEPIFRPDNARDPQFMYRGRKKRSAPVPPFINAGVTKNKMHF